MNVTEKILHAHLVSGSPVAGEEVAIRIDQTLTQDATGTMAYLQFESMGLDRAKTEVSVSYVDHNTVQIGFENADDHDYLQAVAQKYGVIYSKPGNGICHQLHLERFGKPGKTLIGSDSHTPTGGGIGMVAIGAGGIDVAVAMGGGAYNIAWPKVVGIRLVGQLTPGVSAKDVILAVLRKFGSKGNVGKIFEYYGPALAYLDVPSRATITNMGAELGVTTSVFPSDEVTKAFLEAQGRGSDWVELKADDETYDDTWELDLSTLEPLAAAPHNPGNIETVAQHLGEKVHQIMIGSCTNSSYRDIKTVALLLKGKQVHPDVEVGIACGSKQVVRMLADEGLLGDLIAAGCRILENACGFCIGAHMSPSTDAVCLRTSNRNFEGRSGTQSAKVYLVSPETAAASALTGAFADARQLQVPTVPMPTAFTIDDGMFLYRETAGQGVPETLIRRGPNIGEVPPGKPLAETLHGVATIKVGDKITTDHIMPAGARLKYRSNVPEYAKYVFEHTDKHFYESATANRNAGKANIIVAGESYGQGSSREHAALCPMYLGVRAVIAKSIERIHRANLINFGIVPFVFVNPDDYNRVSQGDELVIEALQSAIEGDGRATVKNLSNNNTFDVMTELSERQKTLLLAGGLLAAVAQGKV
ncbi:MAG: aconitate hydratase [Kiritimatiellae bacterium]|nr:aconitate hydratase [Kiritimatiellia bacterium]